MTLTLIYTQKLKNKKTENIIKRVKSLM